MEEPIHPCTLEANRMADLYEIEKRAELWFERRTNALDRQFTSGQITQAQYDARCIKAADQCIDMQTAEIIAAGI